MLRCNFPVTHELLVDIFYDPSHNWPVNVLLFQGLLSSRNLDNSSAVFAGCSALTSTARKIPFLELELALDFVNI